MKPISQQLKETANLKKIEKIEEQVFIMKKMGNSSEMATIKDGGFQEEQST